MQQAEPQNRHYHEPVDPHMSNRGVNILITIFILAFFALVAVGAIVAIQTVIQASVLLLYGSLALVPIVTITIIVYLLWHKWYMDKQKREHAALDVQAKKEEMERQHYRLHPDHLGNYAAIYLPDMRDVLTVPAGNFVQNVPHTIHIERNDHSTHSGEQGQVAAAAASLSLPRIEQFYAAIPFNSLQTGLGLDVVTQQLVLAPIEKSTHFKFVGGSDMGKSCVAAAALDIATATNDPDHLRLGLLDLEYNTSRLFENVPHIAEIGPRRQRLIGRDPDEVAQKLKLLQWELKRRSDLGEAHCRQHEPLLLVYVEEMLALKYEVVDEKLKKEMLAAINILGVRGRKYLIYFLACMQTDYSDKSTREAMAQYRTRGGFAIDPDTARAAGFFSKELIKENFQTGRRGQYVLEKPSYSGVVLAPEYDVKAKLLMLTGSDKSAPTPAPIIVSESPYQDSQSEGANRDNVGARVGAQVVDGNLLTTSTPQAGLGALSEQEKRIIKKYRTGDSISAIIGSEFTNSKGEPLTAGKAFTEKSREIQALVSRFLPQGEA